MTYADFESILVPEDNQKQNPENSYMNKYQKHILQLQFAVVAINQYVLMINLGSLLRHTQPMIQFTNVFII